jgi:hypothetical protein
MRIVPLFFIIPIGTTDVDFGSQKKEGDLPKTSGHGEIPLMLMDPST